MARIGRINKLTVKHLDDRGAHLEGGQSGDILLPIYETPEPCRLGDEVVVMVYLDREDLPRATTQRPFVTVGRFAGLQVMAVTASGAFLDWGMPKDLFVPRSEQQTRMEVGEVYVVFVYIDENKQRIIASSKLDKFLNNRPAGYACGEKVDLIIYAQTDMGYKAVVNQAHTGLLHKNEVFRSLTIGQELPGHIKKIRPDGKIDLCLQPEGYQVVDEISQAILATIKEQGGRIAVTDNSPPEEIYCRFGVSKKSFKKAIGSLYQKRLITLDRDGIRLVG